METRAAACSKFDEAKHGGSNVWTAVILRRRQETCFFQQGAGRLDTADGSRIQALIRKPRREVVAPQTSRLSQKVESTREQRISHRSSHGMDSAPQHQE